MAPVQIRKLVTYTEETRIEGGKAAPTPLRLYAVAAVLTNPWHGRGFVEDLKPEIHDIAPQLGIRQTRRVISEYLLTEDDILGCADFPDTIGVNGWPVEAHTATGVVIKFAGVPHTRGFNHMPYRMIVPRNVDNLLVAGRCASMTHDGQSSARVSGPCLVMGQAAGTAADIALSSGVAPRAIDIGRLQARLDGDGAYLGRSLHQVV